MKFLLLFSIFVAQGVFACSDFNWNWKSEDWIEGADAIYHGMVVSISLDKKSIYDGRADPIINAVSLRGKKHIKFKVFETLKGKKKPIVKTALLECVGGVTDFGDSGLLFKVGEVWHIKQLHGDYSEEVATKILQELSKAKHKSS
jgi:hypothetical protein